MKNSRRWTLEQLSDAVKTSTSLTQVLIKLKLSDSSNNFRRIHKICDDNNLDMSHFTYRKVICDEKSLREAVKKSFSIAQTLFNCGLNLGGNNYYKISRYIKEYNIDVSHFTGQGHLKNKNHSWSITIPLEEILIENSFYNRNKLRIRLIKEKILDNKCSKCGIYEWDNKPISLELDHINGKPNDNRIENLRILCPNCHSQTETYCAKNRKVPERLLEEFQIDKNLAPWEQRKIIQNKLSVDNRTKNSIAITPICRECGGKTKCFDSKVCKTCYNTFRTKYQFQYDQKTKVPHPSKEELQKLLWEKPTTQIAKELGVSDKAVEKWSKKLGCSKPSRGYWAKKKHNKI